MSDRGSPSDWMMRVDDDEDSKKPKFKRNKDGFMRQVGLKYDFDCPECDANNPYDDGFKDGSEVRCYYCGQEFLVQAVDETRMKFKPL